MWSVFYIAVAIGFGVVFGSIAGWEFGGEYFAGYIVEKSLSVDNLFVFVIIMSTFAVPDEHQQKVLIIGIVLALILRVIFILLGAALLELFTFMFLIFGLLLLFTAVQLFRHRDEEPEVEDNALVRFARKRFPVTDEYDGGALTTRDRRAQVRHAAVHRADRDRHAPTCCSRWTRSRRSSASPRRPSSSSPPTRSRCSACARCTSSSPACWTGSSTSRPACR